MVRPKKLRFVRNEPDVDYFKPRGVPLSALGEISLTLEEFEAIKLRDLEGAEQTKAAKKMKVSQSTFHRIYASARKKLADAIVNGRAIKIHGGVYKMARGAGAGRGRMGGFGAGPGGFCVCTKCGNKVAHTRGVPCYNMKCPKCGSPMIRGT